MGLLHAGVQIWEQCSDMSSFRVSLRVMDAIDLLERVVGALDGYPYKLRREGEPGILGPQGRNVLVVPLVRWERGPHDGPAEDEATPERDEDAAHLAIVTSTLERMAPLLSSLDRSRCTVELYMSTIRNEAQGGFELPAELVAAAAAAGVSIGLSILVMLPEEEVEQSM